LPDEVAARHEPSLQLVGRPDHRNLDLTTLRRTGVELTGRVTDIDRNRVSFKPDLAANVAAAHLRMRRVLSAIDRHIEDSGLASEVFDPEPQPSLTVSEHLHRLDLRARGITSVIWATGHRRKYPWLRIP